MSSSEDVRRSHQGSSANINIVVLIFFQNSRLPEMIYTEREYSIEFQLFSKKITMDIRRIQLLRQHKAKS